ncbi:MAG: AbrB family transcriptional regulator, partial [Cypionkella sp.]
MGLAMWRMATMALAIGGAVLFYLLGLPLPFLFGPMLACLLAALAGAPLKGMGAVSVGARTILGVAVGASITPDVLARIPQMAGSVALMPIYIIAIGAIGFPFFRRMGF